MKNFTDSEWEYLEKSSTPTGIGINTVNNNLTINKIYYRYCGGCEYTDNNVYTSNPPQYKCTITGNFHFAGDSCDVEFEPVKKGKWTDTEFGWLCSVCGKVVGGYNKLNFCPHCGAKMSGEQNG